MEHRTSSNFWGGCGRKVFRRLLILGVAQRPVSLAIQQAGLLGVSTITHVRRRSQFHQANLSSWLSRVLSLINSRVGTARSQYSQRTGHRLTQAALTPRLARVARKQS